MSFKVPDVSSIPDDPYKDVGKQPSMLDDPERVRVATENLGMGDQSGSGAPPEKMPSMTDDPERMRVARENLGMVDIPPPEAAVSAIPGLENEYEYLDKPDVDRYYDQLFPEDIEKIRTFLLESDPTAAITKDNVVHWAHTAYMKQLRPNDIVSVTGEERNNRIRFEALREGLGLANPRVDVLGSLAEGQDQENGKALSAIRLAAKLGLPSDYVYNNYDEVKKESDLEVPRTIDFTKTKSFAAWVAKDPTHAAFVRENLLDTNNFIAYAKDFGHSLKTSWLNFELGKEGFQAMQAGRASLVKGKGGYLTQEEVNALKGPAYSKPDINRPENVVAEFAAGIPSAAAEQSFNMIPTLGAALVLGPATGTLTAGGLTYIQESGHMYAEILEHAERTGQKVDVPTAQKIAKTAGVVNTAIEMAATAALLGKYGWGALKGVNKEATKKLVAEKIKQGFGTNLGKYAKTAIAWGADLPQEYVEELVNGSVTGIYDAMAKNPYMGTAELADTVINATFNEENHKQAAEVLKPTLQTMAGMSGGYNAIKAVKWARTDAKNLKVSAYQTHLAKSIDALKKVPKQIREVLRKTPEAVADIDQQPANAGTTTPSKIYVSRDTLYANPEIADKLGVTEEQYTLADSNANMVALEPSQVLFSAVEDPEVTTFAEDHTTPDVGTPTLSERRDEVKAEETEVPFLDTTAPQIAPAQAPTETPAQAPTETPAQAPTETPAQAPNKKAKRAPDEIDHFVSSQISLPYLPKARANRVKTVVAAMYRALGQRTQMTPAEVVKRFGVPIQQMSNRYLTDGALGSYNRTTKTITIARDQNEKTVTHEIAHSYFEILRENYFDENGNALLKEHYETLAAELGGVPLENKEEEITVVTHEKFARLFERYLESGIAPNSKIKKVLRYMAGIIKEVYSHLVDTGLRISPEIAGVFDAMLLTDEEYIRSIIGRSKDALRQKLLGLGPEAIKKYLAQEELFFEKAEDRLRSTIAVKQMSALNKKMAERYRKAKIKYTKDIKAQPIVQLVSTITEGGYFDAAEINKHSVLLGLLLKKNQLIDLDEKIKPESKKAKTRAKMPIQNLHSVLATLGFTVDEVNAQLGMDENAWLFDDSTLAKKINNLAEEAAVGEVANDPKYVDAIQNAKDNIDNAIDLLDETDLLKNELKVLDAEYKSLRNKATGSAITGVYSSEIDALDNELDNLIQNTPIGLADPIKWKKAAKEANKATSKALNAGDVQKAREEKIKEYKAYKLYRAFQAQSNIKSELSSTMDKVSEKDSLRKIKLLGVDFYNDFVKLVNSVDFTGVKKKYVEVFVLSELDQKSQTNQLVLDEYLKSMVDPDLMNLPLPDRVDNINVLTIGQAKGIIEKLKHIRHIAEVVYQQTRAEQARVLRATVDQIAQEVTELGVDTASVNQLPSISDALKEKDEGSLRKDLLAQWMRSPENVFLQMGKTAARVITRVRQHLNAYNINVEHFEQAESQALEAYKKETGLSDTQLDELQTYPEVATKHPTSGAVWFSGVLSARERIGIAMHMGNTYNRAVFQANMNLSSDQMEILINKVLTDADLKFAQAIMDFYAGYQKDFIAFITRVTGVPPTDLVVPNGVRGFKGGYVPVVYDRTLTNLNRKHIDKNVDPKDLMSEEEALGRGITRGFNKTDSGHQKLRKGPGSNIISYDYGRLKFKMLSYLYDLRMREVVVFVQNLVSDTQFQNLAIASENDAQGTKSALIEYASYLAQKPMVDDATRNVDKIINIISSTITTAALAVKATSVLKQSLGLVASVADVPPKRLVQATAITIGKIFRHVAANEGFRNRFVSMFQLQPLARSSTLRSRFNVKGIDTSLSDMTEETFLTLFLGQKWFKKNMVRKTVAKGGMYLSKKGNTLKNRGMMGLVYTDGALSLILHEAVLLEKTDGGRIELTSDSLSEADRIVERYMGGVQKAMQSKLYRTGGAAKLFRIFTSAASGYINRVIDLHQNINRTSNIKGTAAALSKHKMEMASLLLFPALANTLIGIIVALTSPDEEKKEQLLNNPLLLAYDVLTYMPSQVPGVGPDAVSAGKKLLFGTPFLGGSTATSALINSIARGFLPGALQVSTGMPVNNMLDAIDWILRNEKDDSVKKALQLEEPLIPLE